MKIILNIKQSYKDFVSAVTNPFDVFEGWFDQELEEKPGYCQYPNCISKGKNQRCASWKANECPEPGELI